MAQMTEKKKGRPTKYKKEYDHIAESVCELGGTTPEIARTLSVAISTVNKWIAEIPSFSDAVKQGKALADNKVQQSLYNRAIGCSVTDSDIRVIEGKIVITDLDKNFPPDTTAALAWLHNRKRDKWKPRRASEDTGVVEEVADALNRIADRLPD